MCRLFVIFYAMVLLSFIKCQGADLDIAPAQLVEREMALQMEVEKVYLHPSQIFFSKAKIFIRLANRLIQVYAIEADPLGIYCKIEHPKSWICPRCKEYNTNCYYCERCNYPREDRRLGHPNIDDYKQEREG